MSVLLNLGRLEKLGVRSVWQFEDRDFTPWLAEPENLQVLSEALHLELELEAQEKSVGPFRADLLCKIVGAEDHWVLIENQLEKTDHNHLGQLLTYASGLDAVTIIWIAAKFTEEHRSTLDWLNRITDESFRFFGLEVEIWKIGESLAAPKFNTVSKPNNWSKAVSRAARSIEDSALTETKQMQIRFWEGLHEELDNQKGPVSGNRKAQPQSWMSYSIGRTHVGVNACANFHGGLIRAEIYMSGQPAKSYFHQLYEHRTQIEASLGYELQWDELPDGLDCRIYLALETIDIIKEETWPQRQNWLAGKLNEFHKVFSVYIRDLD